MLTFYERKLLQLLAAGDHLVWTETGWQLSRADPSTGSGLQVAPVVVAGLVARNYVIVSPGAQVGHIGKAGQAALKGEGRKVAA